MADLLGAVSALADPLLKAKVDRAISSIARTLDLFGCVDLPSLSLSLSLFPARPSRPSPLLSPSIHHFFILK
jgi:hypothetical protein